MACIVFFLHFAARCKIVFNFSISTVPDIDLKKIKIILKSFFKMVRHFVIFSYTFINTVLFNTPITSYGFLKFDNYIVVVHTLPSHRVDWTPFKKQDEISFLVPPPQLAEHEEFADQGDQVAHGEVLQSTTLMRVDEVLPVYINQTYSLFITHCKRSLFCKKLDGSTSHFYRYICVD